MNIESIYSITVCNFVPSPKNILINTLHMYNVYTHMHTLYHGTDTHAMCSDYFSNFSHILYSQMKGIFAVVQNKSINYVKSFS